MRDSFVFYDGLFNRCNREIYILKNKDKDFSVEGRKQHMNRVLRHEIIHAYLEESSCISGTSSDIRSCGCRTGTD